MGLSSNACTCFPPHSAPRPSRFYFRAAPLAHVQRQLRHNVRKKSSHAVQSRYNDQGLLRTVPVGLEPDELLLARRRRSLVVVLRLLTDRAVSGIPQRIWLNCKDENRGLSGETARRRRPLLVASSVSRCVAFDATGNNSWNNRKLSGRDTYRECIESSLNFHWPRARRQYCFCSDTQDLFLCGRDLMPDFENGTPAVNGRCVRCCQFSPLLTKV